MKTAMKNIVLSLPAWIMVLLAAVFFFVDSPAASAGVPGSSYGNYHRDTGIGRKAETEVILSVLEDRIDDPRLLAKTKEKLSILTGEKIHLIASLCNRISADGQTAGADIAFSLVTALIVLS
jgi:hypothetical protein